MASGSAPRTKHKGKRKSRKGSTAGSPPTRGSVGLDHTGHRRSPMPSEVSHSPEKASAADDARVERKLALLSDREMELERREQSLRAEAERLALVASSLQADYTKLQRSVKATQMAEHEAQVRLRRKDNEARRAQNQMLKYERKVRHEERLIQEEKKLLRSAIADAITDGALKPQQISHVEALARKTVWDPKVKTTSLLASLPAENSTTRSAAGSVADTTLRDGPPPKTSFSGLPLDANGKPIYPKRRARRNAGTASQGGSASGVSATRAPGRGSSDAGGGPPRGTVVTIDVTQLPVSPDTSPIARGPNASVLDVIDTSGIGNSHGYTSSQYRAARAAQELSPSPALRRRSRRGDDTESVTSCYSTRSVVLDDNELDAMFALRNSSGAEPAAPPTGSYAASFLDRSRSSRAHDASASEGYASQFRKRKQKSTNSRVRPPPRKTAPSGTKASAGAPSGSKPSATKQSKAKSAQADQVRALGYEAIYPDVSIDESAPRPRPVRRRRRKVRTTGSVGAADVSVASGASAPHDESDSESVATLTSASSLSTLPGRHDHIHVSLDPDAPVDDDLRHLLDQMDRFQREVARRKMMRETTAAAGSYAAAHSSLLATRAQNSASSSTIRQIEADMASDDELVARRDGADATPFFDVYASGTPAPHEQTRAAATGSGPLSTTDLASGTRRQSSSTTASISGASIVTRSASTSVDGGDAAPAAHYSGGSYADAHGYEAQLPAASKPVELTESDDFDEALLTGNHFGTVGLAAYLSEDEQDAADIADADASLADVLDAEPMPAPTPAPAPAHPLSSSSHALSSADDIELEPQPAHEPAVIAVNLFASGPDSSLPAAEPVPEPAPAPAVDGSLSIEDLSACSAEFEPESKAELEAEPEPAARAVPPTPQPSKPVDDPYLAEFGLDSSSDSLVIDHQFSYSERAMAAQQ
ncbi:uncharacterized protein AMSG_02276 [Thecamonas trahens ATCC 50062]|uniref:Uncharacterized protein n=1 Tax=Thecamonas trahens ATCC 50062 TaxID=461836 RepID=A0A0L0DW53_THETB|nr:hypothetical protein AMSG_02276 [Thecamonas trahens ATCC 50062]KNC56306.1 hypothetical protein AMSG_02276 [Thecamonas trahens ATCC 50062]|eukprot:XP_013760825.1 hypothetical protein AMSG_02276 [Thecamonas trahens ATCC 50062]